MKYPFETIEPKWQKYWEENKTFKVSEDPSVPKEKRRYVLDMFPYPSAEGIHIGHPLGYTATDIYCRYLRMNGYNVLHPMGFDSFGLPAENFAIKMGVHPATTTEKNINISRRQMKSLGFSYDWDREVITSDPDYYKWTQWIFLKLYHKGLAYEAESPINWCPSCKTGIANEEVIDGLCERCKTRVSRKRIRQWLLKITAYADRLLKELEGVDWPEPVKQMQRNWIGRSEGADVIFKIDGHPETIEVYTTRPDTLYGATYMVLAPEHALVEKITTVEQKAKVAAYLEQAAAKSDLERTDLAKVKTGVFSGAMAINPASGEKIPIWIADYVLISYGTGAIMAVPAHDERDWEFAKAFGLPIRQVVAAEMPASGAIISEEPTECTVADGFGVNSELINGLPTVQAKEKIIAWLSEQGLGKKAVNYKLRDWIFSRQRYWGEPIPIVHCEQCKKKNGSGIVPLREEDLPLKLPDMKSYAPTGTGESPLASVPEWVNTVCPKCGGPAKRETNTMPQWAGSCWYHLRYLDPKNREAFADREKIDYWAPVDFYVGGVEHAVLHLLYARFWHKVLYDEGYVNTNEPYMRLINQGLITSHAFQRKDKTLVPSDQVEKKLDGTYIDKETGEELLEVVSKMSKSLKNMVNPDDIIREYGADSLRVYEMFMGPLQVSKPWNTQGLVGISRFLERLWAIGEKCESIADDARIGPGAQGLSESTFNELNKLLHKTIKKVSADTKTLDLNTAISQMMIYSNELNKLEVIPFSLWEPFVIMVGAYAPHLGEELWEKLGKKGSVSKCNWPTYEESLTIDDENTIVVQVNGKVRDKFSVTAGAPKEELEKTARELPGVKKWLEGKTIIKIITVPGRLVNIVIST
ncbi:MAG: leucine--tRNA ligase [Treponema sp.]|nr:leucine--tRNA ligase [Treponema sp.]